MFSSREAYHGVLNIISRLLLQGIRTGKFVPHEQHASEDPQECHPSARRNLTDREGLSAFFTDRLQWGCTFSGQGYVAKNLGGTQQRKIRKLGAKRGVFLLDHREG